MDTDRFDRVARAGARGLSRRGLAGALGLVATAFSGLTDARKRNRKKKTKKLKRNSLGCVNVGDACRGNDGNCCSGVCQGNEPKKGKKDKSVCVAHNVGGCTLERDVCRTGEITQDSCGENTICTATTGGSAFCASAVGNSPEKICRVCAKDTDCEDQGFPAGSACVILTGSACDACDEINGGSGPATACLTPGV
jgi:hypothetical protein